MGVGVLGHQVASGAVVAVQGHAMTGEIEQQPIILAQATLQLLKEQTYLFLRNRFSGVLLCQKDRLVAVDSTQQVRQARGIIDGGGQRPNTVAVGVNADDEGDRMGKVGHGIVSSFGITTWR